MYLTKEQINAIRYTGSHLRIIAGPGSGKTEVLTQRVAYLIKDKKINPKEILVITFTRKAAKEMEIRINNLLDKDIKDLNISTIHSFCYKFIQENNELFPELEQFTILDDNLQFLFILNLINKWDIESSFQIYDMGEFISNLCDFFSRLKDWHISPEEFLQGHLKLLVFFS